MKKIFLFLSAVAILATSCEDKNAYTVTGKVADSSYDSTLVYLKDVTYERNQPANVLDSTMIINGAFTFKGIATAAQARMLQFERKETERSARTAFFIQEPGKIAVSLDSAATKVTGTALNEGYQTYLDKLVAINKTGFEKFGKMQEAKEDVDLQNKLKAELEELGKEMKQVSLDYAKANIQNPAGLDAFLSNSYLFDTNETKELLAGISPEAKQLKVVTDIEAHIAVLEKTSEGKPFTDIKSKDPKDKDIALSDYAGKGKVVLVDFWASWCGPCIKSMPDLLNLYNTYKGKNFEIVGVSLDAKAEAWTGSIASLKLPWPQMSDLKAWESEAAALYGIKSIPHTVLIDKDGTIVGRNLHGEELSNKIAELTK